jgi:predicted secreted Zn-dependent protease
MILKFVAVGLLIISFGRGLSQDTLKCWSGTDKLKWSDFKGSIPLDQIKSSTKAVCPHRLSAHPSREKGILNYRVKLVFQKNRAWTRDTSKYLLAHEQLHFDVGELYARKLRRAIKEVRLREPTVKNYQAVIEALISEENVKQDEYDDETVHGVIIENQRKWEKRIPIELEQLKEYASTSEDCNYKPPLQKKDSIKCWSSGDKLKWSDFRKSVPATNGKPTDGAQCSCTPTAHLVRNDDSTHTYEVKTIFYRYNSWAKAKDTSKYLLAHEQLHFDIAELHARKMRNAFKELGSWTESTANAYSIIIKKIYSDHITQQSEYDVKTNHGTIKERQQEWAKKIYAELEQMKEFASTPEDCDRKS